MPGSPEELRLSNALPASRERYTMLKVMGLGRDVKKEETCHICGNEAEVIVYELSKDADGIEGMFVCGSVLHIQSTVYLMQMETLLVLGLTPGWWNTPKAVNHGT